MPFGYEKCLLVMENAGKVRWNKTLKTTRLPEVGRGVLTTAATAAPSVAGIVDSSCLNALTVCVDGFQLARLVAGFAGGVGGGGVERSLHTFSPSTEARWVRLKA